MEMAAAGDGTLLFMTEQMHLSLSDLSMELKSLGVKPLVISNCHSFSELSEALLSSAWTLVNLVHGRAMGFTAETHLNDREAILRSDNQSLESKIEGLKLEIDNKGKTISKQRENVRQLEDKLKRMTDELQHKKHHVSQLLSKLEAQDKDFKHVTLKQEAEMEHLRNIIRKSLGVSQRQHCVSVDRLSSDVGSLTATKGATELAELQESTLNRLKSVNHTLVGENLMLRDALQILHSEIHSILMHVDVETEGTVSPNSLPENLFQFPLSYCKDKLHEIRQEQLHHLYAILRSVNLN